MNKQIYAAIYMIKLVRRKVYKHSCACNILRKPLKNQKESQQTENPLASIVRMASETWKLANIKRVVSAEIDKYCTTKLYIV